MIEIERARILYQSSECLVINKNPGEACEGALKGIASLPQLLMAQFHTKAAPEAVHRLDVPVSGCCLFSCNPHAHVTLSRAFAQGTCIKKYWAVVEMPDPSRVYAPGAELVHWVQNIPGNRAIAFDESGPQRKKAVLRYQLAGSGEHYLFMTIDLITGRHHQIRAQLAKIGLHIKGDLKYGAKRSEKNGGIRLHAAALTFPNPLNTTKYISAHCAPERLDPLWEAFCSRQTALSA
ncbi:RluA family pseudouridine synthase [Breznakiellaceae bacterium SP9]